jgi:uncharacterized membrane protein (UPF0127 family)
MRPALLSALFVLLSCGGPESTGGLPRGILVVNPGRNQVEIQVEIAETQAAKTRGLMGRTELDPDAGMVFLQDEPLQVGFWMKDTLIPLSAAFWGPDGRIGSILDMEPCEAEPCLTYDPGVAWTGALEVNRGFFEDHGVEVGDVVRLERA